LLRHIGIGAWWVVLPGLIVYLYNKPRTRLWLTSGGRVVVVKGWLGNGKWTLPGGGLHKGEDPLDGVLRETLEETGVRLERGQVRPVFEERFRMKGIAYPCFYFEAVLPERVPLKPELVEISDLAWIDPAELNAHTANPDVLIARDRALKGKSPRP
jgi:8-oxo-dGTP pyrophosphatase MutT (NUDIX family)